MLWLISDLADLEKSLLKKKLKFLTRENQMCWRCRQILAGVCKDLQISGTVEFDEKLDRTANTDGRRPSRLYFIRQFASFSISKYLQLMFCQAGGATSALLSAAVCWGGSVRKRDASRLYELVGKAGSVVGTELDSLASVAERWQVPARRPIVDNPLHDIISRQTSGFSDGLLSLPCSTDRLRRSFLSHADKFKFITLKAFSIYIALYALYYILLLY